MSVVPDAPPPGFAMVMLAPANPAPLTAGIGSNAPVGSFWYSVTAPADGAPPTFQWYVRAQHLAPRRAFRIELKVDNRAAYAVGNARTDESGVLAAYGKLGEFADQYCVGTPAVPIPVTGNHTVAVGVKADGSGTSGGPSGGLIGPERTLACDGNGDGIFDYWLSGHELVHLTSLPSPANQ